MLINEYICLPRQFSQIVLLPKQHYLEKLPPVLPKLSGLTSIEKYLLEALKIVYSLQSLDIYAFSCT